MTRTLTKYAPYFWFVFGGFMATTYFILQSNELNNSSSNSVSIVVDFTANKVKQRIESLEANPQSYEQQDKYAVLINGGIDGNEPELRFLEDIFLAYQTLLSNGFHEDNIFILNNIGQSDSRFPVDDAATRNSIRIVFEYLRDNIDENDLLLVYVVDHGQRTKSYLATEESATSINDFNIALEQPSLDNYNYSFALPGQDMRYESFKTYLSGINPKTGIFIFGFCYSGGFAERLGGANNITIASTSADQLGYSKIGDSFAGILIKALGFNKAPDLNFDGRVSLYEAFQYANKTHSYTARGMQTPMISGGLNPREVFLN